MDLKDTGSLILESVLLMSDQTNETGCVWLDPELRYFQNDENWFDPDFEMDSRDKSDDTCLKLTTKKGKFKDSAFYRGRKRVLSAIIVAHRVCEMNG